MMNAPGGQKPGAGRMMFMLPLFFLSNKINYTDDIVGVLRVLYYSIQVISLCLVLYIKQKVEEKKDDTPIYIPPTPSLFQPPEEANRWKETTYYEHEKEQVGAFFKQLVMNIAFVSFIHFKWQAKPIIMLQSFMGLMNLVENGLIKKFIMGSTDRVWNEKLEGEPREEAAAPAAAPAAAAPTAETGFTRAKIVSKEELNSISDKVYNKELGPDDLLKVLNVNNVDHSDTEGYTPLMVLSSRPDVRKQHIERVVKLGADKLAQDEEGNTALHWAAMKGTLASVQVLLGEGASEDLVAKLLSVKNKAAETALDCAKASIEPDAEAVLAALEKAAAKVAAAGSDAHDVD